MFPRLTTLGVTESTGQTFRHLANTLKARHDSGRARFLEKLLIGHGENASEDVRLAVDMFKFIPTVTLERRDFLLLWLRADRIRTIRHILQTRTRRFLRCGFVAVEHSGTRDLGHSRAIECDFSKK